MRKILDHTPEAVPVFNNTGLEHEATYEFVRECGERWGVEIVWLEYCVTDGEHDFKRVNYGSHATKGEPFDALIEKKGYLPNPVARICTVNLKMRTTDRWAKTQGWTEYDNAIGLRADEPRRVARIKSDNSREEIFTPLASAGVIEADVLAFWKAQPFDLELPRDLHLFGNCVGCFLKSKHRLGVIADMEPQHLEWWAKTEEKHGMNFRLDRPNYRQLLAQTSMFPEDGDTLPCFCTD